RSLRHLRHRRAPRRERQRQDGQELHRHPARGLRRLPRRPPRGDRRARLGGRDLSPPRRADDPARTDEVLNRNFVARLRYVVAWMAKRREKRPKGPPPPDWLTPDDHVVFDRVTKSFGKVEVLKGIDIRFKRHETAVIIGGSGAGKTTLLRLLIGLEKA